MRRSIRWFFIAAFLAGFGGALALGCSTRVGSGQQSVSPQGGGNGDQNDDAGADTQANDDGGTDTTGGQDGGDETNDNTQMK